MPESSQRGVVWQEQIEEMVQVMNVEEWDDSTTTSALANAMGLPPVDCSVGCYDGIADAEFILESALWPIRVLAAAL